MMATFPLSVLFSVAAAAGDPCGGAEFKSGKVTLGTTLKVDAATSAEGKACLAHVAQQVNRNRLIRSVTVSVRVPDAQRTDGKALALARQLSDVMVAAGVPKGRVFAVAPRSEGNDPLSIAIGYTERAPENIVAVLAVVDGDVRVGDTEPNLRAAEPGAAILGNELIATGKGSSVVVRMKDGSGVKLLENGVLKMLQIEIGASERVVKMELLKGELDADVAKVKGTSSRFESSTRNAVASVRGTAFRMNLDEKGDSRLETTEGSVMLAGKVNGVVGKPVEVAAGNGSAVDEKGTVSPPRALPGAPRVSAPLKGGLPADRTLFWEAVPGAAGYVVEVARDADFAQSRVTFPAKAGTLVVEKSLGGGKWFWRVSAQDAAGFVGEPSKVYAFTVVP
jgi:hypothetical protein